jgi:hypothetical protein
VTRPYFIFLDLSNCVASMLRQRGVTVTDGTNRRVSQTVNDNSWWSVPSGAASTSHTDNDLDQYSAVGSFAPTYDTNGNLTCDGSFKCKRSFEHLIPAVWHFSERRG